MDMIGSDVVGGASVVMYVLGNPMFYPNFAAVSRMHRALGAVRLAHTRTRSRLDCQRLLSPPRAPRLRPRRRWHSSAQVRHRGHPATHCPTSAPVMGESLHHFQDQLPSTHPVEVTSAPGEPCPRLGPRRQPQEHRVKVPLSGNVVLSYKPDVCLQHSKIPRAMRLAAALFILDPSPREMAVRHQITSRNLGISDLS